MLKRNLLQYHLRKCHVDEAVPNCCNSTAITFTVGMQVPKQPHKDPRFESLSGHFDKDKFRKQYSFLYNEVMPAEKAALKKQLKKESSEAGRRAAQVSTVTALCLCCFTSRMARKGSC